MSSRNEWFDYFSSAMCVVLLIFYVVLFFKMRDKR